MPEEPPVTTATRPASASAAKKDWEAGFMCRCLDQPRSGTTLLLAGA
jgi:hypothetical protein